jgi:hypothetical protein
VIPTAGELMALEQQLAQAGSPHARALLAGQLLTAWGNVLRSGQPTPPVRLLLADIDAYLEQVDTRLVEAELHRASESALEAALAEGPEQLEWQQWTLDALAARDALEGAQVAVERWCVEAQPAGTSRPRALERIALELSRIDAAAPSIARTLVAANPARRTARDRLTPPHRARAWWFSARADCDALVALWRDAEVPPPETAHCEPCAEDRARARLAQRPPARCVTEDELWKLDVGELPPPRRRLLHKHTGQCPECALALAAVQVPLFDAVPSAESATSSLTPVELARCPQFKVLAFRGPRTRLHIQPEPRIQLREAVVQLAAATLQGFDVDLGPTPRLLGTRVKVTVTLGSGEQVALELTL